MRRTYSGMVPPRGTGRTDQNLQCASLGARTALRVEKEDFPPQYGSLADL